VEDGVYRSAFPTELNFAFLESLNLKTVVILSPENVEEQFISFLKDCGIAVVFIHNAATADAGFRGLSAVAEETVIEALNVLTKQVPSAGDKDENWLWRLTVIVSLTFSF